jgi:hypothetical protein
MICDKMGCSAFLARIAKEGGLTKRLNVTMPDELFAEIEKIAVERGISAVDVIRKFIKLGLFIAEIEKDPNSNIVFRENGKDDRVMIFM